MGNKNHTEVAPCERASMTDRTRIHQEPPPWQHLPDSFRVRVVPANGREEGQIWHPSGSRSIIIVLRVSVPSCAWAMLFTIFLAFVALATGVILGVAHLFVTHTRNAST